MEALAEAADFKEIAHFYCELAQAALLASDVAAARRHIDEALAEYKRVRARDDAAGRPRRAAGRACRGDRAWKRIESQNPAYLALVAERLPTPTGKSGNAAQGLRVLRGYLQQYPSLDLLNTVFSLTLERRGPGGGRRAGQGRAARAIRRCSGSTGCSRRSSSRRPPSAGTTSSW